MNNFTSKLKLLIVGLVLMGTANAEDIVFDYDFHTDFTSQVEVEAAGFSGDIDAYAAWAGKSGVKIANSGWLKYEATGLTPGTYTMEATWMDQNGGSFTTMTLWNGEASGDITGNVESLGTDPDYSVGSMFSNTVTVTGTTATFTIGRHLSGNAQFYVFKWKVSKIHIAGGDITYHNVGSKNFDSNPDSYLGAEGLDKIEAPYDSLGYSFVAWYTDVALTSAVPNPALAIGSDGDKDFYAKWEAAALSGDVGISGVPKSGRTLTAVIDGVENNTGTLSYQWQSGDGTTFADISGATSATYTLTDSEVGKFVRLMVASSIQTGSLNITTAQTVLSASTPTYVITYNANSGTDGYITSEEIAEGSNATLSANPTREGYELIGWNTAADGSGTAFTTASALTGAITVYAQWSIITYTVTFDNGGTYATKTTTIEDDRKIDLPAAPAKEGYTFTGWNTQADGRGDAIDASSTITSTMTVYAQWSLITYTVSFDADGVYATKETTIDSDYKVSLPEAPTKEGFNFKNWNTQADGLGETLSTETIIDANITVYAQWREIINAIPVVVNLNMKHSVDGVSDFGRERHITSHSSNTEGDWEGHEDMMDYFYNELDVYLGRDNGSAGWKNKMVTEDPNKPHWPDLESIKSVGADLKKWYDSDEYIERQQYENRRGSMIMGLNPHAVYPSMDWSNYSKMNSGWQTYDVDAAAYFIAHYLDNNFAKTSADEGEPMPIYWECMNEPDMAVMSSAAMFLSSFEKIYEFHNLTAIEIRNVLGEHAPKVGGFCWGQHDLWAADLINRWTNAETTYYQYSDESIYPAYDNMWLGYDGNGTRATGSTIYQHRKDDWWQWDALYQEFMETCAENMDFYAIHFYDWPSGRDNIVYRTGGAVEATLDMIESYDIDRFGTRKDIVVSEFGTVGPYVDELPYKRRDWENLRPFNQMFMQFLERPSHIVLTMPFAPIKAVWGDWYNDDGSLLRRYPSTMMDPVGDYRSPGLEHEEWEWSGMILWYELWKDVKGTRIDTKSTNPDIQVDAYVDGKHVYLILNNLEISEEYINLNMFDAYDNTVKSVRMTHQYLDENQDLPVNEEHTMASLPAQVKLVRSSTMILDIEYADEVTIDEESKEKKYVSERFATGTNTFGRDKYYSPKHSGELVANVNNVTVPEIGEATLRIGLRTWNGLKASVTVNGTSVLSMTSQSSDLNVRGRQVSRGGNGYYGMIELDVPLDILKENNEIRIDVPHTSPDFSSVQLQVWDMTTTPGRFEESAEVKPTALTLGDVNTLMQGVTATLEAVFTPANTTNKALEWSSSNPSIVSVDEYGVVTGNAASGEVVITATSLEDGSVFATNTITAIAFEGVAVTSVSISEGEEIEIPYYTNTQLTASVLPSNASNQDITWSSSDEDIVYVSSIGKVTGKQLGGKATITASITDDGIVYSAEIEVTVTVMGGEQVFNRLLPDTIRPYMESDLQVVVRAYGTRTVKVEISNDGTIIGQGETSVEISGDKTISVPYIMSAAPQINTEYDVTFRLFNGTDELDSATAKTYMADHYHAESVSIVDGIRNIKIGDELALESIVLPAATFDKAVRWKSLAEAVATVNAETGVVKGVSVGEATIVVTTNDGGLTAQVKIIVNEGDVEVPIEGIEIPERVLLFPNTSMELTYTLLPSWTTETVLQWKSENNSLVSVDENGRLTAGGTTGNTLVIATSASDNSVTDTCQVVIAEKIIVEAENYFETGGDHDGFEISSGGINYNQSGDWGDYEVEFPQDGKYFVTYYIGSPNSSGIGVNLYVDGNLAMTTSFSGTGNWDTFKPFTSASGVDITEGLHTIRIESTGTSDWQWNCDRFEFFLSGISAIEENKELVMTLYPNPAKDVVFISGSKFSEVKVYSLMGAVMMSSEIVGNSFDISALESGIYIVELDGESGRASQKLVVQR